jgi:hypothetical protein
MENNRVHFQLHPWFLIFIGLPLLIACFYLIQAIEALKNGFPVWLASNWGYVLIAGIVLATPLWWKCYKAVSNHKIDRELRLADLELKRVEIASATIEGQLRYRELTLISPDENGNYPILLSQPANFNPYAFLPGNSSLPQIAEKSSVKPSDTPVAVHTHNTIPSARELIDDGLLSPWEKESVLAFTDGKPEMGRWNRNYSFLVYGGSGSGKSSLVSFYTLLAIYHGARILAIDPESQLKDSLTSRLKAVKKHLLTPIGDTVEGARRVLSIARQELENPGEYPVMFLVDEYSTLMRKYAEWNPKTGSGDPWGSIGKELVSLLEDYGQRGRKRGRVAIAIGQLATASRTGGTEVKNSMTALFVMRVPIQTARLLMAGQGRDIIQKCTTLQPGEAQVLFTNAPVPISASFPYVDPNQGDMEYALEKLYHYEDGMLKNGYTLEWTQVEDCMCLVWRATRRTTVHDVHESYADGSTSDYVPFVDGSTVHTDVLDSSVNVVGTGYELVMNAPRVTGKMNARTHRKQRIADLRASGIRNKARIILEVYGYKKGASPKYTQASKEYDEIIDELGVSTQMEAVTARQESKATTTNSNEKEA